MVMIARYRSTNS